MKDNVDKRVVEFQFDNSKFEKNVKQSINTLDDLKSSLNLKDSSKSFDKVYAKFSKLDTVVTTMLVNITNRVTDLGITLVKSLSVDNISSGWAKFGQKTTSVATLMAQTLKVAGKEISDYATKIEVVNEQLDKLNWFTDETSYNFTDMVDNIGKFTAAGQSLDESVNAMMGIANWAALSGQNAATASRAMYQLSQSLGKGYVQLIDYKSIQNANMDTQEFRQTVLDTAVALKQLTKQGDNYITKTGKKFNVNNFSDSLSSKWFTSEVLLQSLGKYSSAVEELYRITEEEGITASEAIEKYGDTLDEFAVKAFRAAQEAKTFSDVIGSIKDAVSTGWMNTFENIFGGYEEAKVFWTDLANELYDVFAEGGNFRNEVLSIWSELEGRSTLFTHGGEDQGAFWNIYDAIVSLKETARDVWSIIFPNSLFSNLNTANDLAERLIKFTKTLKNATSKLKTYVENSEVLQNIFAGLFSILRILTVTFESFVNAISPIIYVIRNFAITITDAFSKIGKAISENESLLYGIIDVSNKIKEKLTNIIDSLNIDSLLDKINNFIEKLTSGGIKLSEVFSVIKNKLVELYKSTSNFLKENISFADVFNKISEAAIKAANNIKNFINTIKSSLNINTNNSIFGLFSNNTNELASTNSRKKGKTKQNAHIKTIDAVGVEKEVSSENINLWKEIWEKIYKIFVTENKTDYEKILLDFATKFKEYGDILLNLLVSIVPVFTSITNVLISLAGFAEKILKWLAQKINKISKEIENIIKKGNNFLEDNGVITIIVAEIKHALETIYDLIMPMFHLFKQIIEIVKTLILLFSSLIKVLANSLSSLITSLENCEKDILETLKHIKNITLILVGIYVAYKAIMEIVWAIEIFVSKGLSAVSDLAYSIKNANGPKLISSIADVIKQIGSSLLKLSLAFYILNYVDPSSIVHGCRILASLIAAATIAAILSRTVETSVAFKKGNGLNIKTQRSTLDSLSYFVKSIGTSFLMLALSFKVMCDIVENHSESFKKVSNIFYAYIGSIAAIYIIASIIGSLLPKEKLEKINESITNLNKMGGTAFKLAAAMLLFAYSLKYISKIENEINYLSVLKVFGAFVVFLATFTGLMYLLNIKSTKKTIGMVTKKENYFDSEAINGYIKSIYKFVGAFSLFTSVVRVISSLKIDDNSVEKFNTVFHLFGLLLISFIAVNGLMSLPGLISKNKSFDSIKIIKQINASLIGFIGMFSLFVGIIITISKINTDENLFKRSIGTIILFYTFLLSFILTLGLMTEYLGGSKRDKNGRFAKNDNSKIIKQIIKSLFSFVSIFAIFSGIILAFNRFNINEGLILDVSSIIVSFGLFLTEFILLMKIIEKINPNINNLLSMSLSLSIFTVVFTEFGRMLILLNREDSTSMFKNAIISIGLFGLFIAMFIKTIKSTQSISFSNILAISVALLSFAVSYALIAKILNDTEIKDIKEKSKGLLIFLGAMAALSLILRIASPVSNGLNSMSNSFNKFGIGIFAISASILLLIKSINELATISPELLSKGLDNLLKVIQSIAPVFGSAIVSIFKSILTSAREILPHISSLITDIINNILEILIQCTPTLVNWLNILFSSLLDHLNKNGEQWGYDLGSGITKLLAGALNGIADNLQALLDSVYNLAVSITKALLTFVFGEDASKAFSDKLDKLINDDKNISKAEAFGKALGKGFVEGFKTVIKEDLFDIIPSEEKIKKNYIDSSKKWLDFVIANPTANIFEYARFAIASMIDEEEAYEKYIYKTKKNRKNAKKNSEETSSITSYEIMTTLSDSIYSITNNLLFIIKELKSIKEQIYDLYNYLNSLSTSNEENNSSISSVITGRSHVRLSSLLSSINENDSITRQLVSSYNKKSKLSSENQNGVSNTTNNNTNETYNITFNVTTDNPEELANETDKILQRRRLNALAAKGG